MKISPQNFVPYLYANKELDQVKSQGMAPETRLYSNADTYSVELGNQGAPIPVTDSWRSEKGLEVGYQIIESAGFKGFKGGTAWKINSFYLKDLDDRDYSNFATAALNAGEDIDTFVLAAGSIFGESGGNREELSEFLEFSAGLSVADLGNFIQTLHNSPEQREQTMAMASSLETGAVGLYLEGAALAGEELETFNQQVGSLLEGDDPGSLAAYFSAVVAAGDRAAEFVDATHAMGVKDRQTVAEFMNSGLT
ncbi:MAG: hypothetical protein MI863_10860, partial [Desulfobacterales bacterium]|nr:hypothetical protein [Desulfobacterales bacterium]